MTNVIAYAVLLVFVAVTETLLVTRNDEISRDYRAVVNERDALRGALIIVNTQVANCQMDVQELKAQIRLLSKDTTPVEPPATAPPVTPRQLPVFPRDSRFSGVRH